VDNLNWSEGPLQLNNKSGFSLIELIASVAIISIAMLGVTTLLYVASAYSQSLTEEFQALSNSYRLEYAVRKHLSLAVRVKANQTQPYEGQVNDVNCTTRLGATPANCSNWTEVAFFNREGSTGGLAGAETEIRPTWFWYKGPVHTGNKFASESGVFVIDNGSNAAGPASARSGAPDASDIYFDQLTEFQTETIGDINDGAAAGGLQRVRVRAVFRYHGVTQVRTWCSTSDIVGNNCNFASGEFANYYDSEYNFNVSLVNNYLKEKVGDGTNTEVRVLGPVHYFRAIYPSGDF